MDTEILHGTEMIDITIEGMMEEVGVETIVVMITGETLETAPHSNSDRKLGHKKTGTTVVMSLLLPTPLPNLVENLYH